MKYSIGEHQHKNKIAYLTVLLLLAAGISVLSGCGGKAPETGHKRAQAQEEVKPLGSLTVYFSSVSGYMVPVSYPFSGSEGDPVKTAVELLLQGPQSDHLFRTIPKGTKLKDCYVSNETAFLDFTKEIYRLSNSKDAAKAVKSLCLTIGSIPGVERVQVLVEGKTVKEIQGIPMSQIMEYSWVNYFGSKEEGSEYIVYYADCYDYLIPVTFVSPTPEDIPRKAVERLIAGPGLESLQPTVSPGTELLGLDIKEGVAYVNFSKEAAGWGGGSNGEGRFVKSLLLTLGQFSDLKGVQILVEGKKMDYLPEGTLTGVPLPTLKEANSFDAEQ